MLHPAFVKAEAEPFIPGGHRWPASPRSHDWKLVRAYEHLEALDDEIDRWVRSDAVVLVDELDPQSGEHRKRVFIREEPPIRVGLLLGDCLQNLRNVLDHLAFALTESALGVPLPKKIADNVCFPILGQPDADKIERCIGKIDPTAKAIIEDLQPYSGRDPDASTMLALLNRLANDDKHRLMNFPLFAGGGVRIDFGRPRVITGADISGGSNLDPNSIKVLEGPLEGGAVVLRYIPIPLDPSKEMQMGHHPIFGIAFPKGTVAEGQDVIRTIQRIWAEVTRRVIQPLRGFLT